MRNTLSETYVFLGALYGGIAIGVLYDVFRVIRLPFKSRIIDGILDFLFYTLAGAAAGITMLLVNGGELRIYVLLALLLGCLLYIHSVGFFSGMLFIALNSDKKLVGK